MKLSGYTRQLISDPNALSRSDINACFDLILHDESVSDIEVASFLTAARVSNRDHKPDFIAAAVGNLLQYANKIEKQPTGYYADIVGTGGDGKDTFNVSTTAAMVVAGTGKVKVAKHGGPASTSSSGASDLLSKLNVDLSKVTNLTVGELLKQNFTYMSGPIFHPILAKVKQIRKQLGIPTIFNLLGPLLNPAPISYRILGVYTPSLGRTYAEAAKELFPNTAAMVVCGAEGLDEISPAGDTFFWKLDPSGEITEGKLHPKDFGLPTHTLEEVKGGSSEENAELVRLLVANKLSDNDPIKDYVLLNSAALLYISEAASNFQDAVQLANESIVHGGAAKALQELIDAVGKL